MAEKVKKKAKQVEAEIEEFEESGGIASRLEEFVLGNRTLSLSILGGAVAIVLGLLGFRYIQQSQDGEAQTEMFQAIYYSQQDSTSLALNGDQTNLGLLDIVSDYSGTSTANQAALLAGINFLKEGDAGSAIEYLEKFADDGSMLTMSKYAALGFAYQETGDQGAAARSFEKAANRPQTNKETTPFWLLHAGQAYEAAGDAGKALSLYQEIKQEYPLSFEAGTIDKYIGRVGG
ncbi:MAG: tetratricopeptide repeat protein [Bacteroidota bacterium]